MAPELAKGEGSEISPRTDVYLLGAMLHEAITGRPPHRGEIPMQKLFRAFLSEPHEYGDDVPDELAALLHRAMHVDPEERFEDVDAFRAALRAFLSHREAAGFAREAEERLEELERQELDEVALWQTFGACRFALREVKLGWPEHPEVPALEVRLAEAMAGHAMRLGRLELAESYLEELAEPSPKLRARLDTLLEEARASAERVEALEDLARDHDLDASSAFRTKLALWLGALFFVFNLGLGYVDRAGLVELGYPHMLGIGLLTAVGLAPVGWWMRKPLFRNRANSAIYWISIGIFVGLQGLWLICILTEVPFRAALTLNLICYLLAFGAITILVSTRFFVSPILVGVSAIVAALFPEILYEAIAVGGGGAAAAIGLTYRRRGDEA